MAIWLLLANVLDYAFMYACIQLCTIWLQYSHMFNKHLLKIKKIFIVVKWYRAIEANLLRSENIHFVEAHISIATHKSQNKELLKDKFTSIIEAKLNLEAN